MTTKRSPERVGKLSQGKGKRFAYLIANMIASALGVRVDLNPHQCKGQDIGRDLLANLPFCFQLEHGAIIHPYEKLADARWSAREGEWPVAIVRRNNKQILAVMEFEDWLELAKEAI